MACFFTAILVVLSALAVVKQRSANYYFSEAKWKML